MSDVISSSSDVSPSTVVTVPTPAASTPVGNDAPKPPSKKELRAKARAEAKAARDAARQAKREARLAAKASAKAAREAKVKAKAARPAEKTTRLSGNSTPELWRAAFQAAAAQASKVDDPFVASVLKECERDFRTFESDMTEQPVTATKLEAMKSARQNLFTVFEEDEGLFINGLKSVRGGAEFVAAAWSDDPVTLARQLLGRMTPKHLGHNGPLLETFKKSMEEYLEIDRAYGDLVKADAQVSARIADGKALIQAAVSALNAAVRAAEARKTLAEVRQAQAERHPKESKQLKPVA